MTENENTDISSLSTIHVTKKDSKKECEKIPEVKEPSSIIKAISEALHSCCLAVSYLPLEFGSS